MKASVLLILFLFASGSGFAMGPSHVPDKFEENEGHDLNAVGLSVTLWQGLEDTGAYFNKVAVLSLNGDAIPLLLSSYSRSTCPEEYNGIEMPLGFYLKSKLTGQRIEPKTLPDAYHLDEPPPLSGYSFFLQQRDPNGDIVEIELGDFSCKVVAENSSYINNIYNCSVAITDPTVLVDFKLKSERSTHKTVRPVTWPPGGYVIGADVTYTDEIDRQRITAEIKSAQSKIEIDEYIVGDNWSQYEEHPYLCAAFSKYYENKGK